MEHPEVEVGVELGNRKYLSIPGPTQSKSYDTFIRYIVDNILSKFICKERESKIKWKIPIKELVRRALKKNPTKYVQIVGWKGSFEPYFFQRKSLGEKFWVGRSDIESILPYKSIQNPKYGHGRNFFLVA